MPLRLEEGIFGIVAKESGAAVNSEMAAMSRVLPTLHRRQVSQIVEHLANVDPNYAQFRGSAPDETPPDAPRNGDAYGSLLACHQDPFEAACDELRVPLEDRLDLYRRHKAFLTELEERFDQEADEKLKLALAGEL